MLDRLSDNEFDQFVINAIKTKGRRAISKLFVNGLSKQQSDISLYIKNVTNIIKKRKQGNYHSNALINCQKNLLANVVRIYPHKNFLDLHKQIGRFMWRCMIR